MDKHGILGEVKVALIRLIIADHNEAYVDKLMDFLSLEYKHRFILSAFTDDEALKDFLLKAEQVELLLISPEMITSTQICIENIPVVYLIEGKPDSSLSKYPQISKIQSGHTLVKEIIDAYAHLYPESLLSNASSEGTQIVAVYSPIGGIGKTSIAVAMSIKASENGKRTLYLNLEHISSMDIYFECKTQNSLSKLMYYFTEKNPNIAYRIESICAIDPKTKVNYFSPVKSLVDLNELSDQALLSLILNLKNHGNFDLIVLDLPSELTENRVKILSIISKLVVVGGYRPNEISKMNRFNNEVSIIESRYKIDLKSRIQLVINQIPEVRTIDFESLNLNPDRPYIGLIREQGLIRIDEIGSIVMKLDNQFGTGIGQLILGL